MGGADRRPMAAPTSACTTVRIAPNRSSRGTEGATAGLGLEDAGTRGWSSSILAALRSMIDGSSEWADGRTGSTRKATGPIGTRN